MRAEKHPGDELLLDRLATDHQAFTFAASPTRPRLAPWRAVAFAVRSLADIARYGDPDYAEAHTLRARSVAKLGLGRIGSRTLAPLLLRLGAPTSRERVRRRLALLQRAEDALPPSRTIARALTAFRPDLVLASPVVEFGSSQVDVLESARSLGLRTGVAVASWDNLTNKGLIRFRPDRVFVWNERQRREAAKYHGIPPEDVVVTGAARFDPWFDRSPSWTAEELAERVGLAPGPYLLYLCSSGFIAPDEVGFVRRWVSALRGSGWPEIRDVGVLVRPHPHNARQWREAELDDLGNVSVHPRVGTHPDAGDAAAVFYDSIAHSEAVVGINTSALIESAIAGKSVYTVLDPQFASSQAGTLHFQYLRVENGGFVHEAATLDEHVRQLADGLGGDRTAERIRIRDFLETFVRPRGLDVPAAVVMADAFAELAGAVPGSTLELAARRHQEETR